MNRIGIIFVFCFALILGCNRSSTISGNAKYFSVSSFFKSEIGKLKLNNSRVEKTITKDGNPMVSLSDSVKWEDELKPFFDLEINKPDLEKKYELTIDSGKNIKISTYFTSDTNLAIQRIAITEANGRVQLFEADYRKRSWIVDRDIRYSYMPGKGFGMVVKENYIWSNPNGYEIYAQIHSKNDLILE